MSRDHISIPNLHRGDDAVGTRRLLDADVNEGRVQCRSQVGRSCSRHLDLVGQRRLLYNML